MRTRPSTPVLNLFSILSILFLAAGLSAFPAQVALADTSGTVSGTVYQADGSTPIADMEVRLVTASSADSACTDSNGAYSFPTVAFDTSFRVYVDAVHNLCGAPGNYVT